MAVSQALPVIEIILIFCNSITSYFVDMRILMNLLRFFFTCTGGGGGGRRTCGT